MALPGKAPGAQQARRELFLEEPNFTPSPETRWVKRQAASYAERSGSPDVNPLRREAEGKIPDLRHPFPPSLKNVRRKFPF
jgi:hypothetical protein